MGARAVERKKLWHSLEKLKNKKLLST